MPNTGTFLFSCVLFFLSTGITGATSGVDHVTRSTGNDCYISIYGGTCSVTTKNKRTRIQVWRDSSPEYDFNSRTVFFRFYPTIEQDTDAEQKYYSPTPQKEEIDFNYLTLPHGQPISNAWTYFIIDKKSDTVFGPFTEAEFMERQEVIAAKNLNWKSPHKTRFERKMDNMLLGTFFLSLIYLPWMALFLIPLLIFVCVRRRYRRRTPFTNEVTENAIKLRKVTIRTTGLMLIGTIIIPFFLLVCNGWQRASPHEFDVIDIIPTFIFSFIIAFGIWLQSGSPLLVSFIISKKLRHTTPAIILLGSTIYYAVWYAFILYLTFYAEDLTLTIVVVGLLSLPVLIPAWIVVLLLNAYYVKKSSTYPGTARSTATSSGSLGE